MPIESALMSHFGTLDKRRTNCTRNLVHWISSGMRGDYGRINEGADFRKAAARETWKR